MMQSADLNDQSNIYNSSRDTEGSCPVSMGTKYKTVILRGCKLSLWLKGKGGYVSVGHSFRLAEIYQG